MIHLNIPISNEYSFSLSALMFLCLFMITTMYKVRWAYSPSVGEELVEIRQMVQKLTDHLIK